MFINILLDLSLYDYKIELQGFDPRDYVDKIPYEMKKQCYIIPPTPTPSPSPVSEKMVDLDNETQILEEEDDKETQVLEEDEETPTPEDGYSAEGQQGQSPVFQQWQEVEFEPEYEIDFDQLGKMCWEKFEQIKTDCKISYRNYIISIRENTGVDPTDDDAVNKVTVAKYKNLNEMTEIAWIYVSKVNDAPPDEQVAKCKELRNKLARDVILGMLDILRSNEEKPDVPCYENTYVKVGVSMFLASVLRVKNKELTGEEKGLKALYKSTNDAKTWCHFFRILNNVSLDDKFVHKTFKMLWKGMLKPMKFHGSVLGKFIEIICAPTPTLDDWKLQEKRIKKLEWLVLLSEKDQHFVDFRAVGWKPSNPGNKRRADGSEVYTEEFKKNNTGEAIETVLFNYWISEFDYQHKVMLSKKYSK
ncbi:hypothetical protein GUITHDRAFT_118948 [Guillardia theta CCMP2712]|uniref:Uncharacterized protein n=1 Tax=Guillardia theta (strain CCMP2712) TaxID=905079 RepID=L1IF78_GUITC|nr:hypothetical protein GUITHDRAFT_118948 [Guillardia theta CCMP2712]EKX34906.1 hypothetical protein GUITHDRAFT_118948 [Guillardia theta CCMP2712]|eukprot:XP_005821886.1 hypothetical protein GUITHDRAFT_118948 [Guillardia theta CCMP2712]